MSASKVTKKYLTTVPRDIRQQLDIGPADVLHWEVVGGTARVSRANRNFLDRRGSIHTGSGSVIDDIQRARKMRGGDIA